VVSGRVKADEMSHLTSTIQYIGFIFSLWRRRSSSSRWESVSLFSLFLPERPEVVLLQELGVPLHHERGHPAVGHSLEIIWAPDGARR